MRIGGDARGVLAGELSIFFIISSVMLERCVLKIRITSYYAERRAPHIYISNRIALFRSLGDVHRRNGLPSLTWTPVTGLSKPDTICISGRLGSLYTCSNTLLCFSASHRKVYAQFGVLVTTTYTIHSI